MAAAAEAPPSPPSQDLLNEDSSNASSPLSDVGDKDGETPDITMSVNGDAIEREESDEESILSDVAETEAETERLFDTPRNERYRDVVVDQFNEDRVYERSPSVLRRAASRFGPLRDDDDELSEPDRPSPMSHLAVDESPTKRLSRRPSPGNGFAHGSPLHRKRRLSPGSEAPATVEPSPKRPASEDTTGPPQTDQDAPMADDDSASPPLPSAAQSTIAGLDEPVPLEQPPKPRGARGGTKKKTRNGVRRNNSGTPDDEDSGSGTTNGKGRETSTDARQVDDAADREAEAEQVDKSAEEAEKKMAAYEEWSSIDGMFGVFTDRLYKDRLARLEEEERSLLADKPTHPEYLAMIRCLDERLQKKLDQLSRERDFQAAALARIDEARLALIWGQFAQEIREIRESTLEALNRQWYDVQAARRSAHSHLDQALLFPKDPAQRVRNATSYNTEVSTLAAISRHEGFPAAPLMKGATASEIESDFDAIRRAKQQHQPLPTAPPAPETFQAPAGLLAREMGPAGEQYIRDNAWTNPRHPAHKAYPQGVPRLDSRVRTPFASHHIPGTMPKDAPNGPPRPVPVVRGLPPIPSAATAQHAPHAPHAPSDNRGISGGAIHPRASRPGRDLVPPIPDLSRPGQRMPAASS